jgi:hypothetical protein
MGILVWVAVIEIYCADLEHLYLDSLGGEEGDGERSLDRFVRGIGVEGLGRHGSCGQGKELACWGGLV